MKCGDLEVLLKESNLTVDDLSKMTLKDLHDLVPNEDSRTKIMSELELYISNMIYKTIDNVTNKKVLKGRSKFRSEINQKVLFKKPKVPKRKVNGKYLNRKDIEIMLYIQRVK